MKKDAPNEILSNLTVKEVMDRWPVTVQVFLKYETSCVGCSLSAFESLTDAAWVYGLNLEQFVDDLQEAIDQAYSGAENR